AVFAQLARERTARHPLRTYLWIPLRRVVRIWFTPRIELLPVSGHVFPLAYMREEDPVDQRLTIVIFFINLLYVGLGIWGGWRLWKRRRSRAAVVLLVFYIVVRTGFLTTLETPWPQRRLRERSGEFEKRGNRSARRERKRRRLALFRWLGVDGHAKDLREAFLHAIFERGSHIVDMRDGKIALHDAVARDERVVLHLAHPHVLASDHFVVVMGQSVQERFDRQFQPLHFPHPRVGRGNVAAEGFDV